MGFGICLIIVAIILVIGYILVKVGGAAADGLSWLLSEMTSGHPSVFAFVICVFILIIVGHYFIKFLERYKR